MCYDLVLALSVDLEDPEVTRIRKEHDMYKLQLDNEMSSMQRRVLKFEEDNKRLKAALQVPMPTVFVSGYLNCIPKEYVFFSDRAECKGTFKRESRRGR